VELELEALLESVAVRLAEEEADLVGPLLISF
jgi:hypothetical protein